MAASPLRVGVIGVGRISQAAHLPAIEKSGKVELAAIADSSRDVLDAVARRYRVPRAVTDPREMLAADGLDAVIIAVPDRFHHSLVQQALRAGHHVLVEKPLATTVAEAEEMAATAAAVKRVLQVGSMKRHDPGVRYAREALSRCAPPLAFTAWYRVPSTGGASHRVLFPPMFSDPGAQEAEAKIKADRVRYLLATHGAHIFDSIRYLAGEVASLFVRHASAGPDHAWQGSIRLREGGLGTFELLADVHGQWQEGYDIHTPTSTVEVRTHSPFTRRASDVRVYEDDREDWVSPGLSDADSYLEQVDAFADAVSGQREVSPAPEDGVAAVRLIEAAAQSVATGREVTL
jgi:predicted dehydrogenase